MIYIVGTNVSLGWAIKSYLPDNTKQKEVSVIFGKTHYLLLLN